MEAHFYLIQHFGEKFPVVVKNLIMGSLFGSFLDYIGFY